MLWLLFLIVFDFSSHLVLGPNDSVEGMREPV